MAKHRTRVGVSGRNAQLFTEADYELIRVARIETLKTMSHTEASVYQRLRKQNADLEFVVRLFDDRLHEGSRPGPAAFVERMAPIINRLKPFATKFEIHNEPNHVAGVEGWGASDDHARSFLFWYTKVLEGLRKACPWAKFGFPGLAPHNPHRDAQWLEICRSAINASDWLACHCYWQYGNMNSDDWGLRFKLYHKLFPGKRIEITEFGNSTPGLSPEEMSRQYVQYYTALNRYPYLGSASAFIASSPDPAWAQFVWMREGGQMLPVVQAVGTMERKAVEVVLKRTFKNGKTVRGAFLTFYDRYGQAVCGNPITDQITEGGKPAQYFERVAMEEAKAGEIRLKAAGAEAWSSRAKIADLQTRLDKLSQQPIPTVEALIDKLSELVAALAVHINALKAELASAGASQATVSSLREQIQALQKTSDQLHADLAAALKAMSEEQSALIEHLQEKAGTQPEPPPEAQPEPAAPAPAPGVKQPAIQDLVDQLPKHPTKRYAQRALKEIHYLAIHHSGTAPDVTPQQMARYHVSDWHWPGIGYHFVISTDGLIYQTNRLESVAYHVASANPPSLGICFVGSFQQEVPPLAQVQAGARLVAWLLQQLHLALEAVKGHQELMSTECPGRQWNLEGAWRNSLLQAVERLLAEAQGSTQ